jgi:hypothetical protein
MEADDLDNLIADSLGGVQSALEGDRKVAPSTESRNANEAVRELQQGPSRTTPDLPGEDFFVNLVKTLQDENFQKAMAEAMQATETSKPATPVVSDTTSTPPVVAEKTATAASSSSTAASAPAAAEPEDFMQNFLKSFDNAVGSDGNFEKQLTSLMTSMLSKDLMVEPLQQIADALEPWLKNKKGIDKTERSRYEAQLRLYKQILDIYKQTPDPLPDSARDQVQRLLGELQALGQPPDEVMAQIAPKEAEEGAENFEDFMKTMGLDTNLGASEQDLLKKLTEDPEELTKMMKEMASGLPEEACKQQ